MEERLTTGIRSSTQTLFACEENFIPRSKVSSFYLHRKGLHVKIMFLAHSLALESSLLASPND